MGDQPEHPPGVSMGMRMLEAPGGYQRGWERHIWLHSEYTLWEDIVAGPSARTARVTVSCSRISVAWLLVGRVAAKSLWPRLLHFL